MSGQAESAGWMLVGLVCAFAVTLILGRRKKGPWPSSRREDVRDFARAFSGPCEPVFPEDREGA